MTDSTAIDAATRRLALALDALEAAVERRREIDRSRAVLAEQLHALGIDRAKLAAELDSERRARGGWRPPTARSRAGSMSRWTASSSCSTRRT